MAPSIIKAIQQWGARTARVSSTAIVNVTNSNRPHIKINIGGLQDQIALLDSGSGVSCINSKLVSSMKARISTRPSAVTLIDAQENVMQCSGIADFRILGPDGLNILHPMYIVTNLESPVLLGSDFQKRSGLILDRMEERVEFGYPKGLEKVEYGSSGTQENSLQTTIHRISAIKPVTIPANSSVWVEAEMETPSHIRIRPGAEVVLTSSELGPLAIPDCLLHARNHNILCFPVRNNLAHDVEISKGQKIDAEAQIITRHEKLELHKFVSSIAKMRSSKKTPLTKEKKEYLLKNMDLSGLEPNVKRKYMKLILDNHDAFSGSKFDLGFSDKVQHVVHLKSPQTPIFVPQFRLPYADEQLLEEAVDAWLRLGVVYKTRSRFNTPLFVLRHPNKGVRFIQDFRMINAASTEDRYSIRDVRAILDDIGRHNPKIFNALDIQAGFHQCGLAPGVSQDATAFTLTSRNQQYSWRSTPLGLKGSTSTFSRLMGEVFAGLKSTVTYLDDILSFASNHDESLGILQQIMDRLIHHGLKLKIQKCKWGKSKLDFLGFTISSKGLSPNKDKIKALASLPPPSTLSKLQKFLGLCNYQRMFVRNFSTITEPLVRLTQKDSGWRKGRLPDDALQAFRNIIRALTSAPTMAHADPNRPFILSCDAAGGSDKPDEPPGIGSILSQPYPDGERTVGYYSRQLRGSEKSYSAIQLEKLSISESLKHWHELIFINKGLTIVTDHKPIVSHAKKSDKILDRLQEQIGKYGATTIFRHGSINSGPDYLSRNALPIDSINKAFNKAITKESIKDAQSSDPFCMEMRSFLQSNIIPTDKHMRRLVRENGHRLCIVNDILYHVESKVGKLPYLRIVIPKDMINTVIANNHGSPAAGHFGISKTIAAIHEFAWWSTLAHDVTTFITNCGSCQRVKDRKALKTKSFLTPWEPVTAKNVRIGIDLTGPYQSLDHSTCKDCDTNCKPRKITKFVMTIIDHFSGYCEFVVIPDKTAESTAKGLWSGWLCRHGNVQTILVDGGREWRNSLWTILTNHYGIKLTITSPIHPESNGFTERIHSGLKSYLQSFVKDDTLDWETYLSSFQYSANTQINPSGFSAWYLTYGEEPIRPIQDLSIQKDSQSWKQAKQSYQEFASKLHETMNLARDAAIMNREEARRKYKFYYDQRAQKRSFYVGDRVLLHSLQQKVGANNKLLRPWSGPYRIERLLNHNNVLLRLEYSNITTKVHSNRIKLFHQYEDVKNQNFDHVHKDNITNYFQPSELRNNIFNSTSLAESAGESNSVMDAQRHHQPLPAPAVEPGQEDSAESEEEDEESIFIPPTNPAASAGQGSKKRFRLRPREPDHAQVPTSAVKEVKFKPSSSFVCLPSTPEHQTLVSLEDNCTCANKFNIQADPQFNSSNQKSVDSVTKTNKIAKEFKLRLGPSLGQQQLRQQQLQQQQLQQQQFYIQQQQLLQHQLQQHNQNNVVANLAAPLANDGQIPPQQETQQTTTTGHLPGTSGLRSGRNQSIGSGLESEKNHSEGYQKSSKEGKVSKSQSQPHATQQQSQQQQLPQLQREECDFCKTRRKSAPGRLETKPKRKSKGKVLQQQPAQQQQQRLQPTTSRAQESAEGGLNRSNRLKESTLGESGERALSKRSQKVQKEINQSLSILQQQQSLQQFQQQQQSQSQSQSEHHGGGSSSRRDSFSPQCIPIGQGSQARQELGGHAKQASHNTNSSLSSADPFKQSTRRLGEAKLANFRGSEISNSRLSRDSSLPKSFESSQPLRDPLSLPDIGFLASSHSLLRESNQGSSEAANTNTTTAANTKTTTASTTTPKRAGRETTIASATPNQPQGKNPIIGSFSERTSRSGAKVVKKPVELSEDGHQLVLSQSQALALRRLQQID